MWQYNLITTNLSTSEKSSLGSDYSYTRDDLVENTVHMQNVKTTELEPYIKANNRFKQRINIKFIFILCLKNKTIYFCYNSKHK